MQTFRVMDAPGGVMIQDHIASMIKFSKSIDMGVESEFNGVLIRVTQDSDPQLIKSQYEFCLENQLPIDGPGKLDISPEFSKELEERREIRKQISDLENKKYELKQQLKKKIFEWNVKSESYEIADGCEEVLQSWFDRNQDDYGRRCITYAQDWAKLIQVKIREGVPLTKELVNELSHQADTDGITGFMYGASKNVLRTTWKHWNRIKNLI